MKVRKQIMNVGYVRVSTEEQNVERQYEDLRSYGITKWFEEKKSGKDTNREELQNMLNFVRDGDIIYIVDFSRLARSTKDLLNITEELQKKNVQLVSLKEKIDTTTPSGKLMLTLIGAIYEFERQNLLDRQAEGIAIAKKRGKYKGRKIKELPSFEFYYNKYKNRELTKTELAKQLHISRPTLDRKIKLHELH